MIYKAFDKQIQLIKDPSWGRGAFAAKRSGKTEAMIIDCLKESQEKPNFTPNDRDPWQAGLIEPTAEMTRKILIPKFESIAKPVIAERYKTDNRYTLDGGEVVYLGSGDKPNRWEGGKYNYIGIDEIFQQKETLFDECYARILDSNGRLLVGGSLGTNIINPKKTWVYRRLIEIGMPGFKVFQWATQDNPHIPKEQIEKAKHTLDPVTFRQMFEINWDIVAGNRVYADFTEDNISEAYMYNPLLPTYCSIDWGWAHPVACLFYQYDPQLDRIIVFDEIVQSRLKLDELWAKIQSKGYNIRQWYCDIAGDQEREQTAVSNIQYFKEKFGVHFKYRKLRVLPTIALVRTFVLNSKGVRRL